MHRTMLQARGHLNLTPIPNLLTNQLMPCVFRPMECLFVLQYAKRRILHRLLPGWEIVYLHVLYLLSLNKALA